jgi:uncharacterized protein
MLRAVQLRQECARVLGSLVEKAITTPQQYPLTLNALVAACNQTTNRDPIVDYDDHAAQAALDELKELRLVRYVLPSHGRSVVRFRHVLDEALGLDARQCAVLAVLMLRGAQTAGELRIRAERMAQFGHVDEVEHELALLASRDEPLARNIGRSPGQKEERWVSAVVDTQVEDATSAVGTRPGQPSPFDPEVTGASGDGMSLVDLRAELHALGSEVAELRRELDALRASLGG